MKYGIHYSVMFLVVVSYLVPQVAINPAHAPSYLLYMLQSIAICYQVERYKPISVLAIYIAM